MINTIRSTLLSAPALKPIRTSPHFGTRKPYNERDANREYFSEEGLWTIGGMAVVMAMLFSSMLGHHNDTALAQKNTPNTATQTAPENPAVKP